jgi:hypothetical protein
MSGRVIAQEVTNAPLQWPGPEPRSGHVVFVGDNAAVGQVFSEGSGLSYEFLSTNATHLFVIRQSKLYSLDTKNVVIEIKY